MSMARYMARSSGLPGWLARPDCDPAGPAPGADRPPARRDGRVGQAYPQAEERAAGSVTGAWPVRTRLALVGTAHRGVLGNTIRVGDIQAMGVTPGSVTAAGLRAAP